MNAGRHPSPVFLLTLHRAGGTVLTRVLNCHPDLVVWGEHVGFINRLAEMDDMVNRVSILMEPKTEDTIADYARFPAQRLTEFDPWANPFEYSFFTRACRDMIEGIFARGLRPGQRWGFKEIRYHRVLTVRFLEHLFPDARFIILRRDVEEIAVSAILASWSLGALAQYEHHMPLPVAEDIVRDVTYALLAIESGLDDVQAHLGPRCIALDYRQLLDPTFRFAAPLFDFCRLSLSDEVITRIASVLDVRTGATDADVTFGGVLSRGFIRSRVAVITPGLRAEIARHGVDKRRLITRSGIGQFSFLMGDHHIRGSGGGISSLFDYLDEPGHAPELQPFGEQGGAEPVSRVPGEPVREPPAIPGQMPAKQRLGVIVPYRGRAEHLGRLLPHLVSFFSRQTSPGINGVKIIIAEQDDELPFNRGSLLNAGFLAIENLVDYVCFHDVDYLPMWADYSFADMPTRIIWWGIHSRPIRVSDPARQTYAPRRGLGGVTLFTKPRFREVNGYSNRFLGWGFEDNDLATRCALHGLAIDQRDGTFIALDHDNAGFTDSGAKSPAWLQNEAQYAENQRDYAIYGTGQEGLSSFAARVSAVETATTKGLEPAEAGSVMRIRVDFDSVRSHSRSRATTPDLPTLLSETAARVRPEPTVQRVAPSAETSAPIRAVPVAMIPRRQKICLSMIVRNEAALIRRCLSSVRPVIDHWVIVDTGSIDNTQDVIRDALQDIPGTLHERPWVDFGHNRTEALALAREHGEYILVIDADDVIEFPPGFQMPVLRADSYAIEVRDKDERTWRPQLIRSAVPWRYEGVLHEILTSPAEADPTRRLLSDERSQKHLSGVKILVSEHGSRRRQMAVERLRSDAALLEAALKTETDPFLAARYSFFLAATWSDADEKRKALEAYQHRATLGGWDQEVFISLTRAAKLKAELGFADDDVVATYLQAHAACPTRAEALHDASRFCRMKEKFQRGFDLAKRALPIRQPEDGLFIAGWIYDYGVLDEYAVNAYWIGKYAECLDACRKLLASRATPVGERNRIQTNADLARRELQKHKTTRVGRR